MIKLFVSDLDGTILMQGETRIKKKILQMIEELKGNKTPFVIASGRSYSALKKFFSHHLLQMYFLCENGALIQYQGKTLYKKEIPKQKIQAILQVLEELQCQWVMAGVHTIYTNHNCEQILKEYRELGLAIMKVGSVREIPEGIVRISVLHRDHMYKEPLSQKLKEISGVRISYQDETWTDILEESVDKSVALEWLLEEKHIQKEEVAVFGDNDNDISMLQLVPHSYAMEWATEEVKKSASYVTDCVIETTNVLRNK